jgi:hypothetical protein
MVYKTYFKNKIGGLPIFPLLHKFIWNWDFQTAGWVEEYIEYGPQNPLILNVSNVFMEHWFTVLRSSVCSAINRDSSPVC